MANREVPLVTNTWVEVTKDTTSIFRLVNEANAEIRWIADANQPTFDDANLGRSVRLQNEESMSRFDEMANNRLWVLGKTGQSVVMID